MSSLLLYLTLNSYRFFLLELLLILVPEFILLLSMAISTKNSESLQRYFNSTHHHHLIKIPRMLE